MAEEETFLFSDSKGMLTSISMNCDELLKSSLGSTQRSYVEGTSYMVDLLTKETEEVRLVVITCVDRDGTHNWAFSAEEKAEDTVMKLLEAHKNLVCPDDWEKICKETDVKEKMYQFFGLSSDPNFYITVRQVYPNETFR